MISPLSLSPTTSSLNAAAGASAPAPGSPGEISGLFLQLLTAQLKSQSPLDPLNPQDFLNQLIQLNTLDQISQIRALLAGAGTSSAAAPGVSKSSF
jgi:flagellar basal-body rod modification protein FlgD